LDSTPLTFVNLQRTSTVRWIANVIERGERISTTLSMFDN